MPKNDKIVLDQIIDGKYVEVASNIDKSTYFEIFVAEQVLKEFELSYDEIESGMVDGGDDGGIDMMFIFVNDELLQEDKDFSSIQKDVTIKVIIIQSKTGDSFSETAVDRLVATTDEIFDLSKTITSLKKIYNESVISKLEQFRKISKTFATKFPKYKFNYYYASKGESIHKKVELKAEKLKEKIQKHFPKADEINFEFLTAGKLLDLASLMPKSVYELKLSETPIFSSEGSAYISLASLTDFKDFITDSNGKLVKHIFEANVRDYQGTVKVNTAIQETLRNPKNEDFWWLNNGVTILATKAVPRGKTLTIENPEIVNGLQTSREIYNFLTENSEPQKRNLLVRIIVPDTLQSRDRIIKATNSQTNIPATSLRSTEEIHIRIEQFLKPYNYYYDRRKNFYKNEGKPIDRIVSIPFLVQAIESIVLMRPEIARGRPSSMFKRDEDYKQLFNKNYDIKIYLACVEILKSTERFLNKHPDNVSPAKKNNLKFFIAMAVSQMILQNSKPSNERIASLWDKKIAPKILNDAYDLVSQIYKKKGSNDQTVKGTSLLIALEKEMSVRFPIPVKSK